MFKKYRELNTYPLSKHIKQKMKKEENKLQGYNHG